MKLVICILALLLQIPAKTDTNKVTHPLPLYGEHYVIDFYSGKEEVYSENYTYRIRELESAALPAIILQNKKNVFIDSHAYDKATGKPYSFGDNCPPPSVQIDLAKLDAIAGLVFSEEEIESYRDSGSKINIFLAINSSTGEVMEVEFYLYYNTENKILLSIPVNKIEAFEKAIKRILVFDIPEYMKNASYVSASGGVFHKNRFQD